MKLITTILSGAVLAAGLTVAVPGCQKAKVPGDATLVASGVGDAWYLAHETGMLYVYDKTWDKIVYAGEVRKGQRVQLSASRDKLYVDGMARVEQIPLGEGSEYHFYLRPDPRIIERRTVVERVPRAGSRTVIVPGDRTVIERVPSDRTVIERTPSGRTVIERVPRDDRTVIEVR